MPWKYRYEVIEIPNGGDGVELNRKIILIPRPAELMTDKPNIHVLQCLTEEEVVSERPARDKPAARSDRQRAGSGAADADRPG